MDKINRKYFSQFTDEMESKKRIVMMNIHYDNPFLIKSLTNCPHFFINKRGQCFQFFKKEAKINCMGYNKENIYVAFENLGMYEKGRSGNNIFSKFISFGIEAGNPYTKFCPWKGYVYWDWYTDAQYKTFNRIFNIFNIKNEIFKSINYDEEIFYFEGVCSRSNFSIFFYDVNPAFDFNKINI